MNCPYCGGTMIKGLFCDRGDSYFLPEGETPPQLWTKGILKTKRAVLLPPESFGAVWAQRPEAFWCGQCRKLIVDYSGLLPRTTEQRTEGEG